MLCIASACAPTRSTGTLPAEVIVVLDSIENELTLVSVDSTWARRSIPLDGLGFVPTRLAAQGGIAVVAGRQPESGAAAIDLVSGTITNLYALPSGTLGSIAVVGTSMGYLSLTSGAGVVVLDLVQGGVQSTIAAPGGPQGFVATRGKVLATIGNQLGCPPTSCDLGPSWLLQVGAGLPRDSIPVSGPGNAGPAVVGADGNLYIISAGPPLGGLEGRLSVVDPVRNIETAAYTGVGPVAPSWIASDGGERVLIASPPGGLMVFNTRERRMTLPFGSGIPLQFPVALVTDVVGRAYVVQQGGCSSGDPGRVRIFGTNLIEQQPIDGITCPIGAAMGEIPADRIFSTIP
ncbi:MAG TPA: hypothetical protein PLL69_05580 [Gemmatimonadales bacterium]|nr:hypothetical protein [Gemmatimonadales bacterium]